MNSLFVKKGDNVTLLAGKNKGKTGKVIAVDPDSGRVVVDGWNIVVKHVKAKSAQSQGGIQKMPGSIDASNVQILCPSCGKATRVAAGTDAQGKKIRVCKHCEASLDVKQKVEKKAKKSKKDEPAAKTEEKPVKKSKAKAEVETEVKTEEKPVKKSKAKAEAETEAKPKKTVKKAETSADKE